MRAYVASKISNRNAAAMLARELTELGVEVTSRWIEVEAETRPEEREGPAWEAFARAWGTNDVQDIMRSEVVVILSVPEGMRGTWVELGMALAWNKRIHWIGGRNQTVFTWLDSTPDRTPIKYHETSEDFIQAIQEELTERKEGMTRSAELAKMEELWSKIMTLDAYEMVAEFNDHFGVPRAEWDHVLSEELQALKIKLMAEELAEYCSAVQENDMEQAFDALIDLVYVALGAAHAHKFPFNDGFRRVHEVNMLKQRAEKASDSKRGSKYDIVKPEGWRPATLSDLL